MQARWRSRRARGVPWSPPTMCASWSPRISKRTRRACASTRARCWPTRRAAALHGAAVPAHAARDGGLFADLPEALANTVEIARRCSLILKLGQLRLPDYPVPDGTSAEEFLRAESARGLARRLVRERDAVRIEQRQARLQSELDVICQMGFAGYFLIVADFIRWARENGGAGGTGPRLRRRLAGGLLPGHHGPRSARIRPAVRALPESRTRLDAGLRRRLLHGRTRPGHRLRGRQVRPRPRLADHHLRHDGGQGGGARCRTRARA